MRAWEATGVAGVIWWIGTAFIGFGLLAVLAYIALAPFSNDWSLLVLGLGGSMLLLLSAPLWGLAAVAAAAGQGRLARPLLLLAAFLLLPIAFVSGMMMASPHERPVVAPAFFGAVVGLGGCAMAWVRKPRAPAAEAPAPTRP